MDQALRWTGGIAAAAVLAVTGVAAGELPLLLSAAIPLVYLGYGLASTAGEPGSLAVSRAVDASPAPPGYQVTVRLTLTNEGERALPDVRVVDGVPEPLGVVDGSPRGAGALGPGEDLTVEYAVATKRGDYEFDPPSVRVRSLGAGAVTTRDVPAGGADRLVCRLDADAPPIEQEGDRYAGQLATDAPGRGLEFHSTRPYRPEDPANRIDWRHYAKRDELTTVNYRERRAASVVLVVDARDPNRVVAGPGRPTAVELAAYAATHALGDLSTTGHEVGVAVVGADGPGPAGLYWLPPGGGHDHRSRATDLLRVAAGVTDETGDADAQRERLSALVPARAQLVLFSPLVDDWPVETVAAWGAQDHPRSVLSPDVLTHNTVSGQFASVRRHARLARCQATGARAVDWQRATPLHVVLEYAFAAEARGLLAGGGG